MENEKKIKLKYYVYAIVPVLSFIAVAILTSYSFYLATVIGNEDNGEVVLKSADVTAMFNANQNLNVQDIMPGYTGEVEFSIYNSSTEDNLFGNYTLMWDIITNEVNSEDFVYTLEGTSEKDGNSVPESDTNKVVNISSPRRIPTVSANIGTGVINTGVTHKYVLKVTFKETGTSQNDLQGKKFQAKVTAKELNK